MLRNIQIAVFLAFKSIARGNKATTILIIFILSLAFINLIFVTGMLTGMLDAINKQVVNNLVSNVVVEPQETPSKKDFVIHAKKLESQIEQIPGVVGVASRYKLAGTFSFDKEKNGKFKVRSGEIDGIDPSREKSVSNISRHIIDGEYLEGSETNEIIIGSELAGGYVGFEQGIDLGGVKVGDEIKVTYSNGAMRDYTVKGIFRVQFGFVDRLGFITKKEAESILSVHDNASQVFIKTKEVGAENKYAGQIKSLVPNLEVKTWNSFVGALGNVTSSFSMISLVITTIGLAVAAITIFILIYVNSVSKKRQIGILKAIGIKQSVIIYSYIFQALFYAGSGVVIGIALTFFVLAPFFVSHPLKLPMGDTSLSVEAITLFSNAISLLIAALIAGFIPSWRAARENILKAIWGA